MAMVLLAAALPCRSNALSRHSEACAELAEGRSEESSLDFTRTLRLNYIFSGNADTQSITHSELCSI